MADLTPKEVFETVLPEKFSASEEKIKNINAKFLFQIKGDQGGTWTVDFTSMPATITEGGNADDVDCVLEMDDAIFVNIIAKKQNAMQAFMMQKLKVPKGLGHSMKLQPILG